MLELVLSPATTQPQVKYAYSNLGYAVVSAMLETRAQESFESLMKKHVFDPLEMRSADFRSMKSARHLQPSLLWGHQADGGKPVDPRTLIAENPTVYAVAGTLHLSIEDYAKFARWQLASKPAPVLRSQSSYDHLHEPLDNKAVNKKYGCGWICLDTELGHALTHVGSNTNTFAVIWVLPKSDFAAVVCTNSGEPQAFMACDEMISQSMMELAANKTEPGAVTPDRLAGRYQRNTIDLDMIINPRDSTLVTQLLLADAFQWDNGLKEFRSPSGIPVQFLMAGERAGKGSEVTIPKPEGESNIEELAGLIVVRLSRLIEMKLA